MDELLAIGWRGIERLMVVGFGGMSIYLGYLLFINVPSYKGADGRLTVPGGVAVVLTRVGPGVFFALFGSVVIGVSLASNLEIHGGPAGHDLTPKGAAVQESRQITFSADVHTVADTDHVRTERTLATSDIRMLGEAQDILEGCVSEGVQDLEAWRLKAVLNALGRSKTLLMRSVWSREWGDEDNFLQWLSAGEIEPVPEGIAVAVDLYRRTGKPRSLGKGAE